MLPYSKDQINAEFHHKQSEFINGLIRNKYYITFALLAQCKMVLIPSDKRSPAPAYIQYRPGQPFVIGIHEWCVMEAHQDFFNALVHHELRHIHQFVGIDTVHLSATYPPEVTKPESMKFLFSMVSNQAKDIALHEDMKKLFANEKIPDLAQYMSDLIGKFCEWEDKTHPLPPNPLKVISEALEEEDKPKRYGCFLEWINEKDPEANLQPDMDYVYYANYFLSKMKFSEDGDGICVPGMSGSCKGPKTGKGHDLHDIDSDPENGDVDPADLSAAADKAIQNSISEGQAMSNSCGHGAGDADLFLGKGKISNRIKDLIKKIRVRSIRCAEGKSSQRYTWGKLNKHWPNMPGKSVTIERTAGVFVIVDVSGSMCSPEILNQLVPAIEEVKKSKVIAGAYSCDAELSPMSMDDLRKKVKGGGGTELFGRHIVQLREWHGIPKKTKIDVIYVSDLFCDLSEVSTDPFINFYPIQVDLKGET